MSVSEDALREQLRQSRDLRKQNTYLVSKYKKYLAKSLSTFTDTNASSHRKYTNSTDRTNFSEAPASVGPPKSTNNTLRVVPAEPLGTTVPSVQNALEQETPLYSKVEIIYGNQRQIRKQEHLLSEHLRELKAAEDDLAKQLAKTKRKLKNGHLVNYSKDSKREEDVVQIQAERLDRQIRILENTMHTIEKEKSTPAVSTRRGWFS